MLALAPRFSLWSAVGLDSQRLYWTMGAIGFALLPHLAVVPIWVPFLIAGAAVWRVAIEIRAWRLPHPIVRVLIAFAAMVGVAATFRTLNGLEVGTSLLAGLAGVKFLETRGTRDCTILLFIGYVLLFAALLYDQSLVRLPYIVGAAWLVTAALLRLHQSKPGVTVRSAVRTAGTMVAQALPVAILLFLFFPRLPGQFWALPTRQSAATGLSDEMSPGDIAELTISSNPAFRVKFAGAFPPAAERYWRGPVLHDFDGRRWRREMFRAVPLQRVIGSGVPYRYTITLEPTQRPWLFALDVPTTWPKEAERLYDLQLVTRRPITALASFEMESHTRFDTPVALPRTMRAIDTALPGNGNPRTRSFAQSLRASVASDEAFVDAVLSKFANENYYYTLTPPLLGDNSVDEFLFSTHRGFCEHFASTFTTLMRAAGIPARVVTGYQGGEYNSIGNYLLVRQSDAHAWSEVWLEDRGWVRVDPTAAVAPQRIERNLDAAIDNAESVPGRFIRRSAFLSGARQTWDAVNKFWNDRVVQYDELRQRSLMAFLGVRDADLRDLGVAIAASLGIFFVGLTLYLSWHYRPRKLDPVVATYEKLCRKFARIELRRELHEGPVDYLQRIAVARPDLAKELNEVNVLYTRLRYGPSGQPDEFARLKEIVKRLAA